MNKLLTIVSILIASTSTFAQTANDALKNGQRRYEANQSKAKPHVNLGSVGGQVAKPAVKKVVQGLTAINVTGVADDINGDDFIVTGKITFTVDGANKQCEFKSIKVNFTDHVTLCKYNEYYIILQIVGDDKVTNLQARAYKDVWGFDPSIASANVKVDKGRADRAPVAEEKKQTWVDVKLEGGPY